MQKPELLRIKSYLGSLVEERNPFSSPDQLKRCGDYIADQFRHFQLTVSSEPAPTVGSLRVVPLNAKKCLSDWHSVFILIKNYLPFLFSI